MVDFDLKLNGMDQLGQNLQAFTKEIQDNALVKMLVAGAQTIADEMTARAPREQNVDPRKQGRRHLGDAMVIKVERKPIGSEAEAYVGPAKGFSSRARWQELGVAAHAIVNKLTKKMLRHGDSKKQVLASSDQVFGTHVAHPGESPRPFMRPALYASGPSAIQAMKESLAKSIKSATRKVSKSYAPARGPKS